MPEIVTALLSALLSALVLTMADCDRPTEAQCPPGWGFLEGVRPSGEFACFGPLDPPNCGDLEGSNVPCNKPPRIDGRIYCTNGQQPIIRADGRTVGCQQRH